MNFEHQKAFKLTFSSLFVTLDNLVGNVQDNNYKTVIGNSKREAALLEVDRRYECVISSNRAYKIDEVSAGIEDLYKIAHGIYFRTDIHGKSVRVTRKVDRATVAAQKMRNLGDAVSSVVTRGALNSEEAREVLSHARDILDTTFSEKNQLSGKIGVHKRHYLNETYKPDNPFAYLRAAKGKITRASKRTRSFQYSGVPSSMFILEEGVKTYYSFDTKRILFAQTPEFSPRANKQNSRGAQEPEHAIDFSPRVLDSERITFAQTPARPEQKVIEYPEPSVELVTLPAKKPDFLPESQEWVPDAFIDYELIKRQNDFGWTDWDYDTPKSKKRHRHKLTMPKISMRNTLDFFVPVRDIINISSGSRNESCRRPVWSRVLTAVWLTALFGTFAVEATRYFTKPTNSHESVKSYEIIQNPILSPEYSPATDSVLSYNAHSL